MYDKRLIGTWKSDKRLTFKYYNFKEGTSDKSKKWFRGIFGKLRFTYTRTRARSLFNGVTEEWKYSILAKDKHSVAIWNGDYTIENPDYKKIRKEYPALANSGRNIKHIHFEGDDIMWFNVPSYPGLREYFRRVSE